MALSIPFVEFLYLVEVVNIIHAMLDITTISKSCNRIPIHLQIPQGGWCMNKDAVNMVIHVHFADSFL